MGNKGELEQIISDIKRSTSQIASNKVDEVRVMKSMLNDKDFTIGIYDKNNGYIGQKSPHNEAVKFAKNIIAGSTGLDRAIELPSRTKMIVDGCTIKLADKIFDNIIRSGNMEIDGDNPNSYVKKLTTAHDIHIIGKNGAVISGSDNFYSGINPKTGVYEKWEGDFWGWTQIRTGRQWCSHIRCPQGDDCRNIRQLLNQPGCNERTDYRPRR